MIGLEIEDSDLARQVTALAGFEPALRQEFAWAGERTGADMKRDMIGGVGKVSGRLAGGINSAVRPQAGVDVDLIMGSTAVNGGYDYGARLDKDGRMVWQSGRFSGRRTWGWFSYAAPRTAQRFFKRNYQLALDKAVRKAVIG